LVRRALQGWRQGDLSRSARKGRGRQAERSRASPYTTGPRPRLLDFRTSAPLHLGRPERVAKVSSSHYRERRTHERALACTPPSSARASRARTIDARAAPTWVQILERIVREDHRQPLIVPPLSGLRASPEPGVSESRYTSGGYREVCFERSPGGSRRWDTSATLRS
jgi:hypothetical protein